MPDMPLLLPEPRRIARTGGSYLLADRRLIALDSAEPQALHFIARRLQVALGDAAGLAWEIVAGTAAPRDRVGVTLSVVSGGVRHPQGYELTIAPEGIHIVAGTAAGAFYAVCTLIQLVESACQLPASSFQLPVLRISDWPDFPARGVMLDISRDRVPAMATLLELIDMLASWKVNQLQLYTEHSFAYRNHPEVWADASPLTGGEILALDAYCRERFIELVPNQNSFGHMERWLRHPRTMPLAETTGAWVTPWGETREGGFSLCPLDPGSLELVRGLFDELLPHFSSRMFNVGCDETFDLGQGRSREACQARGRGRVYTGRKSNECIRPSVSRPNTGWASASFHG
jgi:N-acetyl-beta-hexosaminidase